MSHREIRESLADFARGRLGTERREELERHLGSCADCREWLATYELLARAPATPAESAHPTAVELAEWATLLEELPEAATLHLAACTGCRSDLEVVRAAIRAARAESQAAEAESRHPRERRKSAPVVWALAASAAFLVLAVSILLMSQGGPERTYAISGGALSGEETVSAPSIFASEVKIQSGSKIVFEASDLVSLGDGFVVASGATFQAGTTGRPNVQDEPSEGDS